MERETGRMALKAWAEEDRPREKLMAKGKAALSDAELLAILIGSGTREETAVELSRRILQKAKNNLNELGKFSIFDLTSSFKGIGEAKAISIMAGLELGRRRMLGEALIKKSIKGSREAAEIFQSMLGEKNHEEFWIMMLNRAGLLLDNVCISQGGMTGTVADGKEIFRKALEHKAVSIILCHNHPSGNVKPSEADIRLTKKLKQAGEAIEIQVLDHIIVSDKGYYSFADESML